MSDRGGIGFVIDGEVKIKYQSNGMDLEGYTYLLNFLKTCDVNALKEQARNMVEVDPDAYVEEKGKTWREILRREYPTDYPVGTFYIDGTWIAYNRTECSSIALINLDECVLEIYLDKTYSDVLEGRFSLHPERGQDAVNLFKTIPFKELPDSAEVLVEELYDRVDFRNKKKY